MGQEVKHPNVVFDPATGTFEVMQAKGAPLAGGTSVAAANQAPTMHSTGGEKAVPGASAMGFKLPSTSDTPLTREHIASILNGLGLASSFIPEALPLRMGLGALTGGGAAAVAGDSGLSIGLQTALGGLLEGSGAQGDAIRTSGVRAGLKRAGVENAPEVANATVKEGAKLRANSVTGGASPTIDFAKRLGDAGVSKIRQVAGVKERTPQVRPLFPGQTGRINQSMSQVRNDIADAESGIKDPIMIKELEGFNNVSRERASRGISDDPNAVRGALQQAEDAKIDAHAQEMARQGVPPEGGPFAKGRGSRGIDPAAMPLAGQGDQRMFLRDHTYTDGPYLGNAMRDARQQAGLSDFGVGKTNRPSLSGVDQTTHVNFANRINELLNIASENSGTDLKNLSDSGANLESMAGASDQVNAAGTGRGLTAMLGIGGGPLGYMVGNPVLGASLGLGAAGIRAARTPKNTMRRAMFNGAAAEEAGKAFQGAMGAVHFRKRKPQDDPGEDNP